MCDTTGNHSHSHGVRSEVEKALGDIRANLATRLDSVTKLEAQIAIISEADFPDAGVVAHVLEHVKGDEKKNVARLLNLISKLDGEQQVKNEEIMSPAQSTHSSQPEHAGHSH